VYKARDDFGCDVREYLDGQIGDALVSSSLGSRSLRMMSPPVPKGNMKNLLIV
jgi:hypothetical protein